MCTTFAVAPIRRTRPWDTLGPCLPMTQTSFPPLAPIHSRPGLAGKGPPPMSRILALCGTIGKAREEHKRGKQSWDDHANACRKHGATGEAVLRSGWW